MAIKASVRPHTRLEKRVVRNIRCESADLRNNVLKVWIVALLCGSGIVAVLGISGCVNKGPAAAGTTTDSTRRSVVLPVKPEVAYAIIAINDLEPNIATAEITLTLTNPNPSEASVHPFRWTVYYEDKGNWLELGQGTSESRRVQPNSSTTFTWEITGPVTSTGAAKFPRIDAFSSGQDVQLKASGSIPVDVGSSRFAIPFDISRDFPNSAQ